MIYFFVALSIVLFAYLIYLVREMLAELRSFRFDRERSWEQEFHDTTAALIELVKAEAVQHGRSGDYGKFYPYETVLCSDILRSSSYSGRGVIPARWAGLLLQPLSWCLKEYFDHLESGKQYLSNVTDFVGEHYEDSVKDFYISMHLHFLDPQTLYTSPDRLKGWIIKEDHVAGLIIEIQREMKSSSAHASLQVG